MKQDKYYDIVCLEDELGAALEALNGALLQMTEDTQAEADEGGMGESHRHLAAARNAAMLAGAHMLARLVMGARRPGTAYEAACGSQADHAHRAFADEMQATIMAVIKEAGR